MKRSWKSGLFKDVPLLTSKAFLLLALSFSDGVQATPITLETLSTLNLQTLDLRNRNIGVKEAEALARNTTLTSLDLSDNKVGDEGARHLAANTTLTSLNLSGNKVEDEGARHLATNTTLTSLNLWFNWIKDEGARHLAANTTLTSLDLSHNSIGDEGARHLATSTTLTSLALSSSGIGDEGARHLAANTTLTSLNLGFNWIEDKGAMHLARNTTLTSLNLEDNQIEAEGIIIFLAALRQQTNLQELTGINWPLEIQKEAQALLICNKSLANHSKKRRKGGVCSPDVALLSSLPTHPSNRGTEEELQNIQDHVVDAMESSSPKHHNTTKIKVSSNKKRRYKELPNRTAIEKEPALNLESYLLDKSNLKVTARKGSAESKHALASLYQTVSSTCVTPQLKNKYFTKAITWYQHAASQDYTQAQQALRDLCDQGLYCSLDEEVMVWYKEAFTKAGLDFNEVIHSIKSERYPFKLSQLIFMDLDDSKYAPAVIGWGGSSNPATLNFIHKALYISDKYYKYDGAVMAVDPSGDGEDETAYCVAKRCKDHYFILALGGLAGGYNKDAKGRVGNNTQVLEHLAEVAQAHKIHYILIEKNNDNSYPSLLKHTLTSRGQGDIEIRKLHHSINKEKRIIDTLAPLLESHRLIMARTALKEDFTSEPHNMLPYKFFHQFTHITLEKRSLSHEDRLDAVAMAIKHLRIKRENIKEAEYYEELL